jgi:hypothetical protein
MKSRSFVCRSIPVLLLLFIFFFPTISFENTSLAHAYTIEYYDPVYKSEEELGTPVTSDKAQALSKLGKIYVKDDFVFVNELYKGVHVIDNRDPSNPANIAFITIPGNVDIAIRDNILYADSFIDLVVVDISDPTMAKEIKRIEDIFPNTGPKFLFMVDSESEIIFNRIDDRKGIVVGWNHVRTVTRRDDRGCFPAGTEVLTADGPVVIEAVVPGTEVYTWDQSSGEWGLSPVRTQRTYNHEGDMVTIHMGSKKIQVTGNHPIYVLAGNRLSSRPRPVDIPEKEQGMFESGRWVQARDLEEGDVLGNKSGEDLVVTDLSKWNEITEVYHLEVQGNSNFGVHKHGILVHNKSAGDSEPASTAAGKGGSLARFTIVDDCLYVLSGSDLQLFEIEKPASPSLWERVSVGWDIETIFPYQNKLFIGGQEGMYIYDNSDPANPVQISQFAHVTSCDPVVVEGNYAYVTLRGGNRCGGWSNRLEIIDISDIHDPKLIAGHQMDGPFGLGIDNGVLFICDGDTGLKIFDVSDPYNIKKLSFTRKIKPHDVILHQRVAIVVGRKGLYQYDYQNMENIELISLIYSY